MSDTPTNQSDATPTPGQDAGGATAVQEAPAVVAAQAEDAAYTAAFDEFLAPGAPHPDDSASVSTQAGEGQGQNSQGGQADTGGNPAGGADDTSTNATPDAGGLTDEHAALLKRWHMTPEMVADWSDEQRTEFIKNAAKREADNTRTFKEQKDQIQKLEQGKTKPGDGDAQDQGNNDAGGEAAGEGFAKVAQAAVENAVDTYGPELQEFGDVVVQIGQSADQLMQRVESVTQEKAQLGSLVVDLVIDTGIRDLVGDFPSLSKAEARQQVQEKFKQDWASGPHRDGEGSLLERVRACMGDAAKAVLGTTTESAAQVALVNTTKERLKQQPQAGAGKGRKANPTEDDVYADAFEKHLKPDMNRP